MCFSSCYRILIYLLTYFNIYKFLTFKFQATNENELQNRKSPNQHSEQVTKEVEKNIKENKHDNSNNNPGWLGGLFHKLSIRPTNQAILPDDKDPKVNMKSSEYVN